MTVARLTAVALVVCSLSACSQRSGTLDAKLQGEASLLIQAIERVRKAPNSDKRAPLTALAALPCSHADICAVKDRCAAAYRNFVQALDDIARIEAALVGAAPFTANDLAQAQQALDTARERTLGCANAQSELSRRLMR